DADAPLEIHPDRRSCEAEMTDGPRGHPRPRARAGGRGRIPAERPRRAWHGVVAGPHLPDRVPGQQTAVLVESVLECPCERIDVARRAGEAGGARAAATRVGVLVPDRAAEDAPTPRAALRRSDEVVLRRETPPADQGEVDERQRAEAERTEDPRPAEAIEGLAADRLDDLAEHHETEIAVDRTGPCRHLRLLAMDLVVDPLPRTAARDEGHVHGLLP